MKNISFLLIITSIISLTLHNCGDKEDECLDCNAAIEHMHTRLKDNSCNPDYMENAVSLIKEKCGESNGLRAAYFMAESCCLGDDKISVCQKADYIKYTMKFDNPLSGLLTDSIHMSYEYNNAQQNVSRITLRSGQSHYEPNMSMFDRTMVKIVLYDIKTSEKLYEEQIPFTFIRTGKVCLTRSINVVMDKDKNYDIEFVNWE